MTGTIFFKPDRTKNCRLGWQGRSATVSIIGGIVLSTGSGRVQQSGSNMGSSSSTAVCELPAHLPKGYEFGCLDASKVPLPDGADHCLKACICAPAPHDADALLAKHNVYEARHHHWLKHARQLHSVSPSPHVVKAVAVSRDTVVMPRL